MSHVHHIKTANPGAPIIGCMGGHCAPELRSICAHYHRTYARNLDERMCKPGRADEYAELPRSMRSLIPPEHRGQHD